MRAYLVFFFVMDSHMVAPIPFSVATTPSPIDVSSSIIVPSSSANSFSGGFPSFVVMINSSAIVITNASTIVYLPFMAATISFHEAVVPISNTQQIISLKLSNTNFLYQIIQMKLHLLGQKVNSIVDGYFSYPFIYIASTNMFVYSQSFIFFMKAIKLIDPKCYSIVFVY